MRFQHRSECRRRINRRQIGGERVSVREECERRARITSQSRKSSFRLHFSDWRTNRRSLRVRRNCWSVAIANWLLWWASSKARSKWPPTTFIFTICLKSGRSATGTISRWKIHFFNALLFRPDVWHEVNWLSFFFSIAQWTWNKLREMYLRRYNLRKTALEFFLTDQTNYFLNFDKEVGVKTFSARFVVSPLCEIRWSRVNCFLFIFFSDS